MRILLRSCFYYLRLYHFIHRFYRSHSIAIFFTTFCVNIILAHKRLVFLPIFDVLSDLGNKWQAE